MADERILHQGERISLRVVDSCGECNYQVYDWSGEVVYSWDTNENYWERDSSHDDQLVQAFFAGLRVQR